MNTNTLAAALLLGASVPFAGAPTPAIAASDASAARAQKSWATVRDDIAYLDGLIEARKLAQVHEAAFNVRDDVRQMRGTSMGTALTQIIGRVDTLANALDAAGDKNDARATVALQRQLHIALDELAAIFPLGTLAPVGAVKLSGPVKDPVCRMTVEPATASGRAVFAGQTYYFCSVGDAITFRQTPARFAALYEDVTFGKPKTFALSLQSDGRAHAGKPAPLMFAVRQTGQSALVTQFQLVHEKKMHLIIVSDDLSYFSHEHPQLSSDGRFRLAPTFPRAGRYFLFADFTPADGLNQILRTSLTLDGAAPKALPRLLPDARLSKVVDGYGVSLSTSVPLVAGRSSLLTYTLTRGGKAVTDMQPYLGAMGHMMAINANGRDIVHTHAVASGGAVSPDMATKSGPRFTFDLTPAAPGMTRIWAQFQRAGQVVTVPFTLAVAPNPTAAPAKTAPVIAAAKPKMPTTQTVRVVIDGAYQPATLSVRAGVPTTLSFFLKRDSGCGNSVVIPALNQTLDLEVGQTKSVSFTPKADQTLAFACPMKMFQGTVVAR